MEKIPVEHLQMYRARTFHLPPELRLKERDQAVEFVAQRGFVYFWPITGITFPSLWAAVAGDRPVADEHDDPGHVTWGWKDALLGQRQWYYGKILRKKATMISMAVAPCFYALSENFGAYEEDYLTQYEQGRMTLEARQVYETLLSEGALDTLALRRATHMSSPASEGRFNKALVDLQSDFKIAPVAVSQAGGWRYAFVYDVTARYYPEIPEQAQAITEDTARQVLAELYFRSVGAAPISELAKLFGWKQNLAARTVERLAESSRVKTDVAIEGLPGAFIATVELFLGGQPGRL